MNNFNRDIIRYHNRIRNDAYDSSKYALNYDQRLADQAQQWADYLSSNECYNDKGEHPSDSKYKNRNELCNRYLGADCEEPCKVNGKGDYTCKKAGQNVSTLTVPNGSDYNMNPEVIVNGWYNEIFEDDGNQSCNDVLYECGSLMTDTNKECGHASQVLWKNSQKVGCGYSKCSNHGDDRYFIVCNYDQGNITDHTYCSKQNKNSPNIIRDNLPQKCYSNNRCKKYKLDEAVQM